MNTNNPKMIHETVLRDIVSLVADTPIDANKIAAKLTDGTAGNFSYKNIAKASRDLTLTFPVIVSDAVSVETASMISKAVEKKAVSMLQMLFSAIQITNANNAIDYLKKFHSNMTADSNMGVEDWISIGNRLATKEEADVFWQNATVDTINELNTLTYIRRDEKIDKMLESMTEEECGFTVTDEALFKEAMNSFLEFGDFYLEESYAPAGLNRFTINPKFGMQVTEDTHPQPNPPQPYSPNVQKVPQPTASQPYTPPMPQQNIVDKGVGVASNAMNKVYSNKLVNGATIGTMALAAPKALGTSLPNAGINVINKGTGYISKGINAVAGTNLHGTNIAKRTAGNFANAASKLGSNISNFNLAKATTAVKRSNIAPQALKTGMNNVMKYAHNGTGIGNRLVKTAANFNLNKMDRLGAKVAIGTAGVALANQGYKMYKNWKANKAAQATQENFEFEDKFINKLIFEAAEQANDESILEADKADAAEIIRNIFEEADEAGIEDIDEASVVNKVSDFLSNNTDAAKLGLNIGGQVIGGIYKAKRDHERDKLEAKRRIGDDNKLAAEFFSKQILTTDVQKANEIVPTMLIIKFVSTEGNTPIASNAIIGVKAKLQYVSSKDMMDRLVSKNADKNGLFNFIKATTGQISFWKDFIFALDKAKLDSISSIGKGSSSPIWKMLEHRATMSKIRRWTGSVNDAAAISTLVLSKEEVDHIKKTERMDLMKPSAVHNVMNAYNIMGVIIADETLEKANILFDDGSSSYETVSFSHLERQGSGSDGAYKKVINMLVKKG